jgi:DNA-binding NarL/FixJ family response regulator
MLPTRILLIDDHAMFRSGLRMLLDIGIPGAKIFEANSIDSLTEEISVDVVLLDIRLPGLNGMDGISFLKKKWPQTHILMLSAIDLPETMQLALERGADGFVSKAETPEKMVEAIHKVLSRNILDRPFSSENNISARQLTHRQVEVLELLHQGLSNKLIARQLSLSDNTVRRHVQDILEYFEVASRAEAVATARRQGLVE